MALLWSAIHTPPVVLMYKAEFMYEDYIISLIIILFYRLKGSLKSVQQLTM